MTKYLYLYLLFLGLFLVFFSYYKMGRIYGGKIQSCSEHLIETWESVKAADPKSCRHQSHKHKCTRSSPRWWWNARYFYFLSVCLVSADHHFSSFLFFVIFKMTRFFYFISATESFLLNLVLVLLNVEIFVGGWGVRLYLTYWDNTFPKS